MEGLDLDLNSLKQCRKLWPDSQAAVSLVQARGEHLPYDAGTFDLVVAADLYEHIDTPAKHAVISEVMRVLKPGGRLVLHTDNLTRYDLSMKLRRLKDRLLLRDASLQQHHFAETHTDIDSADHITEIVKSHGFHLKNMSYFPGRFWIDDLIVRLPVILEWLASSYLMSLEKPA